MKTIDLVLTRTIAASTSELYSIWLDPSTPGSPWHGVQKAILNPVVEGLFYHAVIFEGHEWAHYGRFLTLVPGTKIEHTWVSEATRGFESVVHLTFEPHGHETKVTLRHTNLPDDEMGRRHQEGWSFVLDNIAALVCVSAD